MYNTYFIAIIEYKLLLQTNYKWLKSKIKYYDRVNPN